MGRHSWHRLYIAGSPAELETWIDRAFRMRGYQLVQQAQRLEWNTLGTFLSKTHGEECYTIAWTLARSGWCCVLGLGIDEIPDTAVHFSDLIGMSGRDALDFGFEDDVYWCKYYKDGVLEEEFGNLQDRPFQPWLWLMTGDPNDPKWISARLHAHKWLAQGSGRPDLQAREKLVLPKRLHPARGLLAKAEIVRPDERSRLEIEDPTMSAEDAIRKLCVALDLRYTLSLSWTTLEMQLRRVEGDPDFAEAFRQGMVAARYAHPLRLSGQR